MSKTPFNLGLAKQHNIKAFAQSLGLPMMTVGNQCGGFKVVEVDGPLNPSVKKSKFKKRKRK